MNKERSLTWKYFWQQKWEEAKLPLTGILVVGLAIFILWIISSAEKGNWQGVVANIFAILIGIFVLVGIIIGIYEWIRSNWRKAKKRAKRELKKK